MSVLNKHAPLKKKLLRGNEAAYRRKSLRKVITKRSSLEHKCFEDWGINVVQILLYLSNNIFSMIRFDYLQNE